MGVKLDPRRILVYGAVVTAQEAETLCPTRSCNPFRRSSDGRRTICGHTTRPAW
jgi:hypothetical protein